MPDYKCNFILGRVPQWKAAQLHSECTEQERNEANLRTILPGEIVLDMETPETLEECKTRLIQEHYSFFVASSPRGGHIHIMFTDLEKWEKPMRNAIRKQFIRHYNADIAKFSEDTYIAVPERIHWKTTDFLSKITHVQRGPKPNELPSWAVIEAETERINTTTLAFPVAPSEKPQPIPNWLAEMITNGAARGSRHITEYQITKELYNKGYNGEEILKAILRFNIACKPPKPEDEIRRHVAYVLEHAPQYLAKEINVEQIPEALNMADATSMREAFFVEIGTKANGDPIMKFKANLLGDVILQRYTFKTNMTSKEIYRYDKGIYVSDGQSIIEQESKRLMEWDIAKCQVNEVIFHIAVKTYLPEEAFIENTRYVHVKNGIYDTQDRKFLPFTPDIFSLNTTGADYITGTDCPNFKKFISEVLQPEDIPRVQEMIGYCLYKAIPFHKAFMLWGAGHNGKSTLLEALKVFLNEKNVIGIPLQEMGERFNRITFKGKMANIYPDLSGSALGDTGSFKMIVGGDSITAERKNGPHVNFKPYCKHLFSANKIPETKDYTIAFFRRWEIIPFLNEFPQGCADINMLAKITAPEELSGVLNWALEGLERLLHNGVFSNTKTPEELEKIYMRMSDSLYAFCEDKTEITIGSWISKDAFFEAYQKYCRENKISAKTKECVGRDLPMIRPVHETQPLNNGEEGKQVRAWGGIRWK